MTDYYGFGSWEQYEAAGRAWAASLPETLLRELAGEYAAGSRDEEARHAYIHMSHRFPDSQVVRRVERHERGEHLRPCTRHRQAGVGYQRNCSDCRIRTYGYRHAPEAISESVPERRNQVA